MELALQKFIRDQEAFDDLDDKTLIENLRESKLCPYVEKAFENVKLNLHQKEKCTEIQI